MNVSDSVTLIEIKQLLEGIGARLSWIVFFLFVMMIKTCAMQLPLLP